MKEQVKIEKPPVDIPKGVCLPLDVYSGMERQRDADVAYYEPLIQQAKEEVAREIFEWGNEPCPHQFYANTKQQCRACWDELRNKVFGNPSSPNT